MEFDKPSQKFSAPYPIMFGGISTANESDLTGPQAQGLRRDKSRLNQVRMDTKTLIWGEGDSLPLRVLSSINESPTTSSCIGKIESFIRGSGFTDKGLENMVVDEDGTTLIELHSKLCSYMARLEGFSVNTQYNSDEKIVNAFNISTESIRFKKETENSKVIQCLVYNPYFGSAEYANYQTDEYPFFNMKTIQEDMLQYGEKYNGQVYFFGRPRPPYKFYPVPKFWSGQGWIYVDGQIQKFHKGNLDNGFFGSTLINVIGDPNAWSTDPTQMRTVKGSDGVDREEPTKTVGQMFNEQMAATFSGAQRSGASMVMWSLNEQQYVKISAFPVNTNFDVMSGTFTDAIRGITIATEVPAILANLPQQANSLGSDGNAFRMAIEIMNANAKDAQSVLQNYYNNILIKNHVNGSPAAKVQIVPYSPVTTSVPVDKQFWDFMNEPEKTQYIKDNVPTIKINRVIAPTVAPPTSVPTVPAATPANDLLKSLSASEQDKLFRVIRKFSQGKIGQEMATTMLKAYGLTDQEINEVLGIGDTTELQ